MREFADEAARVHGSPVRVAAMRRHHHRVQLFHSQQSRCASRMLPHALYTFANSSSWKVANKYFQHVHIFRSLPPPSFSPVVRQLCCPPTHELIPVHRIGRALRVTLTSSGSGTAAKHLCQERLMSARSRRVLARLPVHRSTRHASAAMQSTHRWWRMWWCTAPGRGRPGSALGPCRGTRLPGR